MVRSKIMNEQTFEIKAPVVEFPIGGDACER